MDLVNAEIRLGGNQLTSIWKTDLTIPEVIVLKACHGEGSVVNAEQGGECQDRPDNQERERLVQIYGPIVFELWPGRSPQLPRTYADIIDEIPIKENPEALKAPPKPAKQTKAEVADKPRKPRSGTMKSTEPAAEDKQSDAAMME